jgi:hypothetical protein
MMTPVSFFVRHASKNVARSMLRTRLRMPTAESIVFPVAPE